MVIILMIQKQLLFAVKTSLKKSFVESPQQQTNMKKLIDIIDTTNEPNILQKMEHTFTTEDKKTKGGKRKVSGRKRNFYQTKTVAFRVRVEWVNDIKKVVANRIVELTALS